jgi:hypothetical protein
MCGDGLSSNTVHLHKKIHRYAVIGSAFIRVTGLDKNYVAGISLLIKEGR